MDIYQQLYPVVQDKKRAVYRGHFKPVEHAIDMLRMKRHRHVYARRIHKGTRHALRFYRTQENGTFPVTVVFK